MRKIIFTSASFLLMFCLSASGVLAINSTALTTTATPTKVKAISTNVKLFSQGVKKGQENDKIKELQYILKSDSSVYPEGLTTGYFGSLTEAALKRLQEKYGIPVTGVLDEATQEILFPPKVEITVVAPNGGETWDKSQIHKILWRTLIGQVNYQGETILPETTVEAGATSDTSTTLRPYEKRRPFFARASIDLIKSSSLSTDNSSSVDIANTIYHVATVNLFSSQYNWRIPDRIPAGKDYKIRISVGGNVPCLYRYELEGTNANEDLSARCPMSYPAWSTSDTSNGTFAITGNSPPPSDIVAKLKRQVAEMEKMISGLSRQLKTIKELIEQL